MVRTDKLMETLKTDPLEYNRQTGRTTRMMEAAKAAANAGAAVVVLFKDEMTAKVQREKYSEVAGLSVIPMKVRMPELDWRQMKFVDGPYANHKLFIDHDVIFLWHKELFQAYHRYDRPLDISPYQPPVEEEKAA